jgi:hypothetical protein
MKVSVNGMAYLNAQEQQALRDDLKKMSYRGAKWKLRGMDDSARLRYQRTNQEVGKWLTRYDLPALGVAVTLVETNDYNTHKSGYISNDYTYVDAIVEPLPDVETDPSRTGYVTSRPG